MSEQNMPAKLREGIDAAKRGDKTTARRLLQQVLSSDGNNEMALMWMASVVEPLDERRFFLERALKVNPNNTRASEALKRLGGPEPVQTTTRLRTSPTNRATASRSAPAPNTNLFLIAVAVVAFVVIAVIIASAVSSLQPQTVTPTLVAVEAIQQTRDAFLRQSQTPTISRVQPTATLLPGIVVTLDAALLTPLPPTFTPTFTPPPTETPVPSPTPLPLSQFTMIYSDLEPELEEASLYQSRGDGTGEVKLASGSEGGFNDVAYDPVSDRIAFVRATSNGSGEMLPQIFVAPLSAPEDAEAITALTGSLVAHPRWSPAGNRIVFSANPDGDEEIWSLNVSDGALLQLTNNTTRDFAPSISPDGDLVIFTSEADSPGFSQIYQMTWNGTEITRLSEVPISKEPAFSPDGERIAYVNNQQGDDDIYVMDANGERSFLVTLDDGGATDSAPVWSPDGKWIYFASNREDGQLGWYVTDLQGNWSAVTVPGRTPQSLSFVTG